MTNTDAKIMREAGMTRDEEIIAVAENLSRMGDLIRFEELALAQWPGTIGHREQQVRVYALKAAYKTIADKLRQDTTS
jgi:hypothetical protein